MPTSVEVNANLQLQEGHRRLPWHRSVPAGHLEAVLDQLQASLEKINTCVNIRTRTTTSACHDGCAIDRTRTTSRCAKKSPAAQQYATMDSLERSSSCSRWSREPAEFHPWQRRAGPAKKRIKFPKALRHRFYELGFENWKR